MRRCEPSMSGGRGEEEKVEEARPPLDQKII